MARLTPIHPGEILKVEFLTPLGLSATSFAKAIGVPTNRITRIIGGTSAVTADTSIRLGLALRTSPEFWMNLQSRYELQMAEDALPALAHIKPVFAA
ncbi:MAG: addiction module antidote protein, HigA family [Robiginitomaculum sp.]|nr:MAG: addiction module antidote protein, HigA family [Robiginitomaculum sp.]